MERKDRVTTGMMKVVLAAAQHRSFKCAAEELGVSHSTVAKNAHLYQELTGVKIFITGPGSVTLAPEAAHHIRKLKTLAGNIHSLIGEMNKSSIIMMKMILEVARMKSFTKAARELGVSRSKITKDVKRYQKLTKTTLFITTTRSVTVTHSGAAHIDKLGEIVGFYNLMFEEPESPITP